jgi:Glycosyltransferase like family 2
MTEVALSVVVAAANDDALLAGCLASLRGQGGAADVEVIVASNYPCADKAAFPFAQFVELPAATTVPALRAAGMARSRGAVVAFTEDNCAADPRWCAEIRRAHAAGHAVVGGVVEPDAGGRWLDWAVYFYDYGKYAPPGRPGEIDSLPGNNLSYRREVLEGIAPRFRQAFFETFVNAELRRAGGRLYFHPAAAVIYRKRHRFTEAAAQCYHAGRSFGGMRGAEMSWSGRGLRLLGSLALPALLPARIFGRALRAGHYRRKAVASLPHLVALMACWSAGELCGYALGEGGSSRMWK